MAAVTLDGGCLCGAVRFQVSGKIRDAGYCHCRMCQRLSGAPVVAWLTVPASGFRYTKGSPKIYRSSAKAQREACPTCSSQLVFRADGKDIVDITTATLDTPDAVPPEYHIWRQSRIAWFETTDTLPRHDDSGPDWTP